MRGASRRTWWLGIAALCLLLFLIPAALALRSARTQAVPNVCGVEDRSAAERTLVDAGYQVQWDADLDHGQACFLTMADGQQVVHESPQGRAPRGTVIHLLWDPGMQGA
jgi:hypothetical protein